MRICNVVLSAVFAFCGAGLVQAREIAASDVLARAAAIQGEPVTVKNCSIVHASRDHLACATPGNEPISVLIDGGTLNRADLRSALKNCHSATASDQCDVDVAGIANRIGSFVMLTEADIFWKNAGQARPTYDAGAAPEKQALPQKIHVAISNCTVSGANREFLSCVGQKQPAGPHFVIFTENLPAADVHRARTFCSGWNGSETCTADIAGKLTAVGTSYYRLDHPGIVWKQEEVALD